MTATHRLRIKDIERADLELAALRDQQSRIGARIKSLESTRKEDLLALATDILNGLNLAQVPVSIICAHLTALDGAVARRDGDHTATVEENADDEKVEAFVRISRNAGKRKRTVLEQCGLHWHGRDAGWTGVVGSAALAQLRDVFADKVEKPPLISLAEPPLSGQESAVAPAHADEDPERAQSKPNVATAECTDRDETTSTPVHKIAHFRGFPPRPQAPRKADEPV